MFETISDEFKEENSDMKVGAINLANSFFEKRPLKLKLSQAFDPASVKLPEGEPPTVLAMIGRVHKLNDEEVLLVPLSPRTAKLRQKVKDLDAFDEKLQDLVIPSAGSAKSFPKKKKK